MVAPAKKVQIIQTPEEIQIDYQGDTCLNFDINQQGDWNDQALKASKQASNLNALEAKNIKEINIPMHADPEFLYSDSQTCTTVSSNSSTETADSANNNVDFPSEIDVFEVFIVNDDETLTQEEMKSEISEISYMIPTPKNGTPRDLSLTPISIMVIDTISTIKSRKILKVLFDPGSTKTMISRKVLPKDTIPKVLSNTKNVSTLAGTMQTKEMVHLRNLKLPEFDKNRRIDEQKALVFYQKCRYDIS